MQRKISSRATGHWRWVSAATKCTRSRSKEEKFVTERLSKATHYAWIDFGRNTGYCSAIQWLLHIHDVRSDHFRRVWNSRWSTVGDYFAWCVTMHWQFVYDTARRLTRPPYFANFVDFGMCAWFGCDVDLQLSWFEWFRSVVRSLDSCDQSWIRNFRQFRGNYAAHTYLCRWIIAQRSMFCLFSSFSIANHWFCCHLQARQFGLSVSMVVIMASAFASTKLFPVVTAAIYLYGSMSIYAVVCSVGVIFIACLFKETKGINLDMIGQKRNSIV